MQVDRFTEQAQDSAARAYEIVQRYKQVQVDNEHLLLALLEQTDGIVPRLVQELSVDVFTLQKRLDDQLRATPKIAIHGSQVGQIFYTSRIRTALELSQKEANRLKDKFISTEHILIAITSERDTPSARILQEFGITRDRVTDAIETLRGNKQIANQRLKEAVTPTASLTVLTPEGKPDPAIGHGNAIQRITQVFSRRTKNNEVGNNKMKKPTKIDEFESKIRELIQQRQQSERQAAKLLHYGKQQSLKLSSHFDPRLADKAQRLKSNLATRPISTISGWQPALWENWDPVTSREDVHVRIGDISEDRSGKQFILPAFLPFIGSNKTIIIHTNEKSFNQGEQILQSLVVRTAMMLPHQARYTLLDPAGHGKAFPMQGLLPQVRQTSGDVRRDLDLVIAHIRRINAEYLSPTIRSFENIPIDTRINEKFEFVFAANFPNKYDRRAIEALQSIGITGPSAGVYVFVHYNQDRELPRDMSMDGFENAFYFKVSDSSFIVKGSKFNFQSDQAPDGELQKKIFKTLSAAKPPERIIEWDDIVKTKETEWWTENSNKIIHTPIGIVGNGEPLNVWFGVNKDNQPCAHGMLGAMTGSGKSNLYHVLITGLATRYSPEDLQLFLIDGKNGVEFQFYRDLPHVAVISLRSSPELSRSVLRELIDEMDRRNDLFTAVGVSDLLAYRQAGQPKGNMPRLLLLVDEYQELFEDDKEGLASAYLLQLSQQGRSAGIHMLLASQRFGAAGMLNQKGIFGNIHLRMAMQMVREDIEALTEFGRNGKDSIANCDLPGKIVVNDQSGGDEANRSGKVVYLNPEQRHEILGKLVKKAQALSPDVLPRRVIFDGQEAPELLDDPYIAQFVHRRHQWPTEDEMETFARKGYSEGGLNIPDWSTAQQPRIAGLGQEFNVRGQARVVFRRDTSENVIFVGNNNHAVYGMIASLLATISVNFGSAKTEFTLLDLGQPNSEWSKALPTTHEALVTAGFTANYHNDRDNTSLIIKNLLNEFDRRTALTPTEQVKEPTLFITMTELEKGPRELRREQDRFGGMVDSPLGQSLARLLADGGLVGTHFILSFSSVTAMSHIIDPRKGLNNFRHRIALQMGEEESHTFIRSRKASRLQQQGNKQVRALYVDMVSNKEVIFKPYMQNDVLMEQVLQIGNLLARRNST